MHVTAINDNHVQPYDMSDNGQGQNALEKVAKLHSLRITLAQLDPAIQGPAILQPGLPNAEPEATPTEFPTGWLHELWAPHQRDHATAMAWALSSIPSSEKPLLWVTSSDLLREQGVPYGHGFKDLEINPDQFVLVKTSSQTDSLWALEEAIKSGAFAAVIGELSDIDLTSSRRLSLAVQAHEARCLLLMRSEIPPQSVAYSRWRIEARPSRRDADKTESGWAGHPCLQALLHKHRGGELPRKTLLEWQDAHHRFHMVSSMVDQPLGPDTDPRQTAQESRATG